MSCNGYLRSGRWSVPEPADPERPRRRLSLERYLAIYDSRPSQLSTYFVVSDRVDTGVSPERRIHIHGDIQCRGDLVLHVDERLSIDADKSVRGTDFSYDAEWLGPPRRKLFRYDNAHVFVQYKPSRRVPQARLESKDMARASAAVGRSARVA